MKMSLCTVPYSVCTMVMVMVVVVMSGRWHVQGCSLGDIQSFQRNTPDPVSLREGRWFVNKAYGLADAGSYSWYTLDIIATVTGMATVTSKRQGQTEACFYSLMEANATADGTVLISNTSGQVTAAMDSQGQFSLRYTCMSVVTGLTDQCLQPTALLLSRDHNPEAASRWLTSVNSSAATSLPCFQNSQGVVVQKTQACPLQQTLSPPGRNCTVASFPVQQNFDLQKYVSKPWKEMAWLAAAYLLPSLFYQDYQHSYTIRPDNTILCEVTARNPQDNNKCLYYQINMTETSTPGKLIFHDPNGVMPYNVINADYDHMALVYGCVRLDKVTGTCRMARGWLWSRATSLEPAYRRQAHSLILDLCLNPAAWFLTQHNSPCSSAAGDQSTPARFAAILTVLVLFAVFAIA